MRIIINDLDIRYIDLAAIEKFFIKTHNTNYLYSKSGIYIMVSDKFYKLHIYDTECEHDTINNDTKNIKIILNKSYIEKDRQLSQLPYDHILVKESINKFQLHEKSLVSLNITKLNDTLHDIYFETNEEISNHSVKEDIITFLSMLN